MTNKLMIFFIVNSLPEGMSVVEAIPTLSVYCTPFLVFCQPLRYGSLPWNHYGIVDDHAYSSYYPSERTADHNRRFS